MVARDEEYSPSLSRPSSVRREDQNLGLSEPGNAVTCQPIQAESPYSFVQLVFQVQISLIQGRKASLRCLASVSQPHYEGADEWIVKRECDDELASEEWKVPTGMVRSIVKAILIITGKQAVLSTWEMAGHGGVP